MWTPDKPPIQLPAVETIAIDQVLYEFDGPMIFTASFGMFQVLFSRIDEGDQTELYALGTVTEEIISAIAEGSLSVRGGVLSEPCFVMELDGLKVRRCWSVEPDELPFDLLPERGLSLIPGHRAVPDTIEQVSSYFSVRFSGEKLSRKSMLFSTFKSLVDKVYDSSRHLIAPAALQNTKSATFDFRVLEPAFGSLILNIEAPFLKLKNVRKHLNRPDLQQDVMQVLFDKSREDFFDEIVQLLQATEDEEGIREAAERHIDLLTNLQELIPHEDTEFTKVEFNASLPSGKKSIVVDELAGERLRNAYLVLNGEERTVRGVITIINHKRGTFVIQSAGGRETTCDLDSEIFAKIRSTANFRGGNTVEVTGKYYRRARRDYLTVDGIPSIFDSGGARLN